jgi:hypothetical protein
MKSLQKVPFEEGGGRRKKGGQTYSAKSSKEWWNASMHFDLQHLV